jgi:hypothetical protein
MTPTGKKKSGAPAGPRRPYSKPALVVYGDAVTLTQSRRLVGPRKDGGKGLKMRTQ